MRRHKPWILLPLLAALILWGWQMARAGMIVLKHKGGATPLATDTFTGTDGASIGANWATAGTQELPIINANHYIDPFAVTADAAGRYTAITWPNDQYSQVRLITLATANVGCGPAVRMDTGGAETFYRSTIKGPFGATAVARIEKFSAGSYSTIVGNTTVTVAANDLIRLTVVGSTLTLYKNGAVLLGPQADGSPIASGQAGIGGFVDSGTNTDAACDDWEGGSIP